MKELNQGLYQVLESNLQNSRETKPFGFFQGKLIKTEKARKFTTYTLETGVKHPREFVSHIDEGIFWEKGIFYVKLKKWVSGTLNLPSFFYSNSFASPNRGQGYLEKIRFGREMRSTFIDRYVRPNQLFLGTPASKPKFKDYIKTEIKSYKGIFLGNRKTFPKGRYIPYRPFYAKPLRLKDISFGSKLWNSSRKLVYKRPLKIKFIPPRMFYFFWGGAAHRMPTSMLGVMRRTRISSRRIFNKKKWFYRKREFFLVWSCYKRFKGVLAQLKKIIGTPLWYSSSPKQRLYKKYVLYLFTRYFKVIFRLLYSYKRKIAPLFMRFLFYEARFLLILKKERNLPPLKKKVSKFNIIFLGHGLLYRALFRVLGSQGGVKKKKAYALLVLVTHFAFINKKVGVSSGLSVPKSVLEYRSTAQLSYQSRGKVRGKKESVVQVFSFMNRRKAYIAYRVLESAFRERFRADRDRLRQGKTKKKWSKKKRR